MRNSEFLEEYYEKKKKEAQLPQQEISDEEIEKGAKEWYDKEGLCKPSRVEVRAWVMACKWYREQLKQRQ